MVIEDSGVMHVDVNPGCGGLILVGCIEWEVPLVNAIEAPAWRIGLDSGEMTPAVLRDTSNRGNVTQGFDNFLRYLSREPVQRAIPLEVNRELVRAREPSDEGAGIVQVIVKVNDESAVRRYRGIGLGVEVYRGWLPS